MAKASLALRLVIGAYRRGALPSRGFGVVFDRTPTFVWGGADVTVLTDVGPLTLPVKDHGARQLLVYGRILHEERETAFLRRVLGRFGSFLDVGANYGWYARLACQLLPRGSPVVAVEANPHLIPYLDRNVEAEVVAGVVWDADSEVDFHVSHNSALSSAARSVGAPISVAAVTLDQLAADRGRTSWDFVKCDVEGGEERVLRGARKIRRSATPPVWMIEVDGQLADEAGSSYDSIQRELRACGPVSLYRVNSAERLVPFGELRELAGTGWVNVIVVPASRRSVLQDLILTGC